MTNGTKVQINDRSVESAGLPNDYKEAIAEFIWNSFDAKAKVVNIEFDTKDPIGNIRSFKITDDGEGIVHQTLPNTFGAFLDSEKRERSYQRSSYTHGRKGKGRFSFEAFASKAKWDTTYDDDGNNLTFEIEIDSSTKDYFHPSKPKATKNKTGTEVTFTGIHSISAAELGSDDFLNFLNYEFGWFLYLNRKNGFSIRVNGKALKFEDVIADTETISKEFEDSDKKQQKFRITYVRWNDKIGDKFYFYFLNSQKYESGKILTSFNNKADEFYHSVYVESDYFDQFTWATKKERGMVALLGRSQSDKAFRELSKYLGELLAKKRKEFVRANSERIISRFESEGVMPHFDNNKYDKARREDFEEVVKEIYSVEPKIFLDLGKEQKQTFLGLLNLVLDSDERENVMSIIDNVVQLSKEERNTLANILRKTTLQRIIRTIKLIEQRYETVEILRSLVFDLKKFTTERDHIQDVVQNNYWLFGEQYNLVSADKPFEEALSEYLYIVDDKKTEKEKYKMNHPDRLRRPDIFMCRKRTIDDPRDVESDIEESIIVELKTPAVKIGMDQFRQVQDYLNIIIFEDRFNAATRRWKFYVVGNEITKELHQQCEGYKDKGKRYLAYQVDKYEVYALTWDDLFRSFETRHKFVSEKLEFDKEAIREELDLQGIDFSRIGADALASKAIHK
jgi:hypothetical protein